MDKNYKDINFISKYLYFKKASRVASFADIIKNSTMFIKNNLWRLKKSLAIWKLCIKMQSIPVFPDITKIADFRWKNADVSRTQGVCHVIHIFFGSSLGKV